MEIINCIKCGVEIMTRQHTSYPICDRCAEKEK